MGDHLVRLDGGWAVWELAALRSAGMPFSWLADLAGDGSDAEGVTRLLAEPRFLEALTWQNPTAVANWIGRHADARAGGEPLPISRKRAALLARYAQRYCAKNDTIGHFGPVAWARLRPGERGVRQVGGAGVRSRTVHFETWALESLVDHWSSDEQVREHLPVRLHPAVSFRGNLLRRPWRAAQEVDPLTAAVLARLGGTAPPLGELVRSVADALGSAAVEVRAEIDVLVRRGVVLVGLTVPLDDHPERAVRAQLRSLPPGVRDPLVAQLDELERGRDEVAAAADDPSALAAALAAFDSTYRRSVDRRPVRGKAESRVGRLALYSDSRRDLDVVVGGDVLDTLRGPLALVLDSARWLAAEIADAVAEHLQKQYAELRTRESEVFLSDLYLSSADVLSGAPGTLVHGVVDDFQQRWAEVLASGGVPDGRGGLRFALAEVTPVASVLFPPRQPRWNGGRYHSPDLMLAVSGDRVRWVLGELHMALNTLESRVFHSQADERDELTRAVASDMAAGRVVALHPSDSPEVSPRTYPPLTVHVPGKYVYWSFGRDVGPPEGARGTPATGLLVRDTVDGLEVGPLDGSWRAPVLEVLGELLTALVVDRFRPRVASGHQVRISVDDLVICRQSWRFDAADLAGESTRLLDALRASGVPRRVFVRTPAEPKPFFVDLGAPLLVRNMVRAVRLAAQLPPGRSTVDVVELSPDADELWVRDLAGAVYTSELRVVAVDEGRSPGIRWTDAEQGGLG
ncbi:hypothetical protein SUDANB95_04891 [Actinosynnema sp. ALI-1.44]